MALARARGLRSLQSSLRPRAQPLASRLAAPTRTQLVQRRYASGGGHDAHEAPGSDIPWLIGAIAVTIPSCWYLWPDSSHADHHGGHGHEEHAEEEGGEEKAAEGGDEEGGEEKGGEEEEKKSDDAPKEEDDSKDASESKDEGDSKDDSKNDAESKDEGESKDESESKDNADSKDKPAPKDRKIKKKDDSGQQIGVTKDESGNEKKESGAKHSVPIQSDPEKSKKGEGSPETAKMHGTVDPSRPQK